MHVLASGPWAPEAIDVRWLTEPYEPDPAVAAAADAALAQLAARGSPSHDSMAARLAGVSAAGGRLELELQPVRWSLRLVEGSAGESLFVHCLVRDRAGRWLAGRRSPWLAVLPGSWHLGAAGSVAARADPVATIRQELDEEWGLAAERLTLAALLGEPSGRTVLLATAAVLDGAAPRPNHEHDDWSWWPADVAAWPAEATPELRAIAAFAETLVRR